MSEELQQEPVVEEEQPQQEVDMWSMPAEDFAHYDIDAEPVEEEEEVEVEEVVEPESEEVAEEDTQEEIEEASPTEETPEVTEEETKEEVAETPEWITQLNEAGIPVQNLEELKYLAQKGMSSKQPDLEGQKLVKMLQNAKVDASKLNHLLDIAANKPEAIAALVKQSGLEAYDMDDKAEAYTPTDHSISDQSITLDNVLAEVNSSEGGSKLIKTVADGWDATSHKEIAANPQLLHTMNQHVKEGAFERVIAEVQRQRMFGGLMGMSDLDAYRNVGQSMAQSGAFSKAKPVIKLDSKPVAKDPTASLKKAAATGSKSIKSTPKQVKNVWAMTPSEHKAFGEEMGW